MCLPGSLGALSCCSNGSRPAAQLNPARGTMVGSRPLEISMRPIVGTKTSAWSRPDMQCRTHRLGEEDERENGSQCFDLLVIVLLQLANPFRVTVHLPPNKSNFKPIRQFKGTETLKRGERSGNAAPDGALAGPAAHRGSRTRIMPARGEQGFAGGLHKMGTKLSTTFSFPFASQGVLSAGEVDDERGTAPAVSGSAPSPAGRTARPTPRSRRTLDEDMPVPPSSEGTFRSRLTL